jgi:hypothetical protein
VRSLPESYYSSRHLRLTPKKLRKVCYPLDATAGLQLLAPVLDPPSDDRVTSDISNVTTLGHVVPRVKHMNRSELAIMTVSADQDFPQSPYRARVYFKTLGPLVSL